VLAEPRNEASGTQLFYRVLFSFTDPLPRSITFADPLDAASGFQKSLPPEPHNIHEGKTYHFPHPDLQMLACALHLRNTDSHGRTC